jgi:hypothetical protein
MLLQGPRGGLEPMGVRHFLILFFSAMAVSLVILIVFFSLFFKNIDLTFDIRMPESAPELQGTQSNDSFQAQGTSRSTINVPGAEPVGAGLHPKASATEVPLQERPVEEDTLPELPALPPLEDTLRQQDPFTPLPREPKPDLPREPLPKLDPAPGSAPAADAPPVTQPKPAKPVDSGRYQVIINLGSADAAQAEYDRLKAQGMNPIVRGDSLQLGIFTNKDNAESFARQMGAQVRPLP